MNPGKKFLQKDRLCIELLCQHCTYIQPKYISKKQLIVFSIVTSHMAALCRLPHSNVCVAIFYYCSILITIITTVFLTLLTTPTMFIVTI